ncbi:MAG: hypothetical protein WBB07_17560 [Mycobacterium sp.]
MRQRFAGDRRAFDPDSFVGTMGRFFRPISAEYDGSHTTIEYERVPMEQMGEQFGHFIDKAQDRMAVAETFGGQL